MPKYAMIFVTASRAEDPGSNPAGDPVKRGHTELHFGKTYPDKKTFIAMLLFANKNL
jgi:hypothetical protein